MQLYPHWLDGEFVRIASNATGPEQDVREMIRALKLHALLGTQFVLNDVQIFDSAAVLELFADDDALKFLFHDRTFLDLRVEPDPTLGNKPFALAARGLTRTRNKNWKSSLFMSDPTPIKRLADEIIDDVQVRNYVDPQGSSRTMQTYPQYKKWLEAARRTVNYFGMHEEPQKMVAPAGERTNYYEVLRNSLEKLGEILNELNQCEVTRETLQLISHKHEDIAHVNETLKFIDKEIEDPDKRKVRSCVLAILDHEPDRTKREWIWNNVVQAWNYATQKTLHPDGGSVGTLSGAVSPAPFLETTTDVLVPIEPNNLTGPMTSIADPPTLPIDIEKIKWKEIAEVREATVDTRRQLALVRSTGNIEQVSQPLRDHLNAIGRILHPPKKVSKIPYVLKVGEVVIAVFSSPLTIPLKVATIGHDIWRDAEPWRQRRALTNTLFRAAVGQPK